MEKERIERDGKWLEELKSVRCPPLSMSGKGKWVRKEQKIKERKGKWKK